MIKEEQKVWDRKKLARAQEISPLKILMINLACGDKYCPPGHMCKNFCSKTYYYEKCEQKCVKESERICK